MTTTEAISGARFSIRRLSYIPITIVFSAILTICIEFIVRGTGEGVWHFLGTEPRAMLTTTFAITFGLWIIDAVVGRSYVGMGFVASALLLMALSSRVKNLFLGAPLYPTDFVFLHQIIDLFPLLIENRMFLLTAAVAIPVALFAAFGTGILRYRRARPLPALARAAMVAISVPSLVIVGANLNYRSFSQLRIFLGLEPMVWDQAANYRHNGFLAAFAMNVPMAMVSTPSGYSKKIMATIPAPGVFVTPTEKPDVVMVMVESLWDPRRLEGVTIEPDPLATFRKYSSGHVFSPEMGGLTANVEFEALTGFSNAFLPDGSVPYQQYVRHKTPSLASMFGDLGYVTRALHPYREWFWNRASVYKEFGFDEFRSKERLPVLEKRGPEASDSAFVEELIRQADRIKKPFFFFGVTLQNHGPYRPGRYKDTTLEVSSPYGSKVDGPVLSYAEGALDADRMLARLIEWAENRQRPTIIIAFGDHLPPLASVYTDTGYLHDPTAKGDELVEGLMRQRETPLVIWSNRTGAVRDLGTISPAYIPLHLLRLAGISHPFYTGFLGHLFEQYPVVERRLLKERLDSYKIDWTRHRPLPPSLKFFWLVQYDQMFGRGFATDTMFPKNPVEPRLSVSAGDYSFSAQH
ncbi:phosphoglycerol transferase MdoB-like AlkP superfamily enzyme [Mesorhizobium sp. J18]|uniref:LTA synthase family protein n=1 Tax=Mesorhizobium sp. J18 TaxID=935263 RepID=UPI00119B8BA5|nr:LTA synthase family protein [Mesorhizobium sp. J18]TWH01291.1 phosphoglycerol transferase MdoB-like AlkP superfamily enzyme [Mesorhizobium sp. J18]